MIHLCPSSHLAEGNSRGFLVDERRLFAVRRDGRAYIYLNRCPHRGIPLEWQPDAFLDDSASLIRCASHGALFLIEVRRVRRRPLRWRALARPALPGRRRRPLGGAGRLTQRGWAASREATARLAAQR